MFGAAGSNFNSELRGNPASGDPSSGAFDQAERLLVEARQIASDGDPFTAGQMASRILELQPGRSRIRVEAGLMQVRADCLYGQSEAWKRVQARCEALLQESAVRTEERVETAYWAGAAHRALWAIQEFEVNLRAWLAVSSIPFSAQRKPHLELARALLWQGCPGDAMGILQGMSGTTLSGVAWPVATEGPESIAEACLLRGQCLQCLGHEVEARLEWEAVGRVPGLRSDSAAFREARLRLAQLGLSFSKRRAMRVLFVGSSHTLMGNVPMLLERIAASAGLDVPEIFAGEQARMGTGMRLHWLSGEGPDTARRRILKDGPWDAVIVEAFYRNSREELLDFGSRYRGLVQQVGARLVVYGTPMAKDSSYPSGWRTVHENQRWLVNALQCDWAPGILSMINVLGGSPKRSDFDELYKDWIHSTARGAYLSACTIYSALTGRSPEGLYAPHEHFENRSALPLQRAAWMAYLDSLPSPRGARHPDRGRIFY